LHLHKVLLVGKLLLLLLLLHLQQPLLVPAFS
jgi:hypothetical protein